MKSEVACINELAVIVERHRNKQHKIDKQH